MSRSTLFAYLAACVGLAYAALSLYWALGGQAGLDTLGAPLKSLAHSRSAAAKTLIWTAVLAKSAIGLLPMVFYTSLRGAWLWKLAYLVAAGLVLYGSALVVAGSLVLVGAVRPAHADFHALRWHVGLWDAWFLVWGLLLGAFLVLLRRESNR